MANGESRTAQIGYPASFHGLVVGDAPEAELAFNHLPGENRQTMGRIGEVRLAVPASLGLDRSSVTWRR